MADKSDTPRTDALANRSPTSTPDGLRFDRWAKDGYDLARTLERELAAAQADIERYVQIASEQATDLTTAQSAKEELLVALREAREYIERRGPPDDSRRIAREKIDALLTKHGN